MPLSRPFHLAISCPSRGLPSPPSVGGGAHPGALQRQAAAEPLGGWRLHPVHPPVDVARPRGRDSGQPEAGDESRRGGRHLRRPYGSPRDGERALLWNLRALTSSFLPSPAAPGSGTNHKSLSRDAHPLVPAPQFVATGLHGIGVTLTDLSRTNAQWRASLPLSRCAPLSASRNTPSVARR